MDSLTQAALGATVSVVAFRGQAPIWKSALWGAALGTLPDLDVLLDYGDPIQNMTEHRGFSHALFFHLLAAPLLALFVGRTRRWVVPNVLVLSTHALLDAITVYGTKLWLPFSSEAVGVGSIFIIDPLYTLWLLPWMFVALTGRGMRALQWARIGLIMSTVYLVWTVGAQTWVTKAVSQHLPSGTEKLLVTPSAFNTILWRVVAISGEHYYESWVSLLEHEPKPLWSQMERGTDLLSASQGLEPIKRLTEFSDGFVSIRREEDALFIQDLRMGQEPSYVFQFRIDPSEQADQAYRVSRAPGNRPPIREGVQWIYERATLQTLLPFHAWLTQQTH